MNFRKVILSCLVLCLAGQIVLLQAQTRHGNLVLQKVPPASGHVKAVGSPVSKEVQTVVLKLSGSPVAVVQAGMPGKILPDNTRLAIVKNLQAQQSALIPSVQAMGGTVLATFQHAINGIKVRATPDEIASMSHLPGVVAVKSVRTYHIDNALSVPFIGTPKVWNNPPGLHGEHIKVAIIDTGVDYTHANFGGPGTVAAFQAAFATSTMPADPTLFGPNAPKVKGGYDFVGDAYDANNPSSMPMPDPNPLDCNGHGSHTSGTATGFGVDAAGNTYHGPYDLTTPSHSFIIGPGVAPEADLYAYRVFGCSGSTNVVVEALDRALADGVQVVSMSLGADFGNEDSADAEASENLVNAGIVVAAASGNAGPIPFITSDPGTGTKAISVAAMDSHTSFPGANLALTPTGNIVAQDSNGYPFSDGTVWPVVVLRNPDGTISLGCNPAEYTAAGVTGKLVVTKRGTCARVARAIFGQEAGAAAVAMINTSPGYPPYEGQITSDPDTGQQYTVTIPFLGVLQSDGNTLAAATQATATNSTVTNPTARQVASFSSFGPRTGDGHVKPEIAAPGVSIFSTLIGSGNQGVYESGTSMATPHVAGVSALTIQAHPTWTASDVSNAVVNTADAAQIVGYNTTAAGNGLVQPYPAVLTSVSARGADGTSELNFGVSEFTTANYTGSQTLTLVNHGAAVSFTVSVVQGPSVPHTATPSTSSITVPGHGTATLSLKLTVPILTNGNSSTYNHVEGRVVLTPTSGNNGVKLSVPYYLVSGARSVVTAKLVGSLTGTGSSTAALSNATGLVPGSADFYAWGLAAQHQSTVASALRAVGVQSYTDPTYGQILVFAVNSLGRLSNPSSTVEDIFVDVNGDGTFDYDIEAADLGLLTTGTFNGQVVVAVFNLSTGAGVLEFLADARLNGSTILMPLVAADIGITATNPRFTYVAQTTDLSYNNVDLIPTAAKFNAFNSSISTGAFASLGAGTTASVPLTYNSTEAAITPTLGAMVVSLDNNTSHGGQALLLPVN